MLKISVIIPVYNVEKYLARCLDNVLVQTYTNLEIICVNDCSLDNSAKILEEYTSKDKRIKIVNRAQNGGLSAARNSGLEVASGEYIYFLDSDDWIDLNYIEKMVDAAQKSNCVIVQNLSVQENYENGTTKKYPLQIDETGFIDYITAINKTPVMTWTHLFKKEFLEKYDLKFPEGFIHEDIYFHHITKSKADKIYIFKGSPYHYFQREDSIIYARKSKILPIIKITEKILDYYLNNEIENKDKISILNFSDISEIQTEEEYLQLKIFLEKLLKYYKAVNYKLVDFEEFSVNEILDSPNLDNFTVHHKKGLKFSYLRYNIAKGQR